jgi:hypothetical protein
MRRTAAHGTESPNSASHSSAVRAASASRGLVTISSSRSLRFLMSS